MAAKKSTTPPVRATIKTNPVPTKPVAAKPIVTKPMLAVAPPAMSAPAEAPSIEDVVGISPAVETLKKNMAELPKRISGVVDEMKKSQTEVNTQMDKAIKSAEEFVAFGQGNVEAFVKSGQIWASGLQDLSKHFAASAQASIDETVAGVKALSSVKSFKEAVDLQSAMTKTAMEKLMAETGKLSDASMKLAEQAIAPLTARVTLATEKFTKVA